jgi:hypothetical protein
MQKNMLNLLSLLKKNLGDLMNNLVCFRIHGLIDFHGQSQSLGMMVWLFKFVTNLREKPSYWFQSLSFQKHVGH